MIVEQGMNRGLSSFQQPEILIYSATHRHGWQMEHFPLYLEYFSSYTLSMCMLMVTIFPVFMLFLPTSKKTHTTTCCHNYLCCDQIFTLKMSLSIVNKHPSMLFNMFFSRGACSWMFLSFISEFVQKSASIWTGAAIH